MVKIPVFSEKEKSIPMKQEAELLKHEFMQK